MNAADLLAVLGNWSSDNCNADIDRDGEVGIGDFLQLLGQWGDCP